MTVTITNPTQTAKQVRVGPGLYETLAPEGGEITVEGELDKFYALRLQDAGLEIEGMDLDEPEETGTNDDPPPEPGPTGEDRLVVIREIMAGLSLEEFTKAGEPDVKAVNAKLPLRTEVVTAKERSEIWAEMSEGGK